MQSRSQGPFYLLSLDGEEEERALGTMFHRMQEMLICIALFFNFSPQNMPSEPSKRKLPYHIPPSPSAFAEEKKTCVDPPDLNITHWLKS